MEIFLAFKKAAPLKSAALFGRTVGTCLRPALLTSPGTVPLLRRSVLVTIISTCIMERYTPHTTKTNVLLLLQYTNT